MPFLRLRATLCAQSPCRLRDVKKILEQTIQTLLRRTLRLNFLLHGRGHIGYFTLRRHGGSRAISRPAEQWSGVTRCAPKAELAGLSFVQMDHPRRLGHCM